jgi:hypothetical protein
MIQMDFFKVMFMGFVASSGLSITTRSLTNIKGTVCLIFVFNYSPMRLSESRSRHDLRLLLTLDSSASCYQYLKIYAANMRQMSLQSCFLSFSANSFLRFDFVFQKTVLFRTLLITTYQLIGQIY